MKALITGGDGQDGYYLTRFLQEKGYTVLATEHDVTDAPGIQSLIRSFVPDEIYNLAAVYDYPSYKACMDVNAVGAVNVLWGAGMVGAKFLQAGTRAMFGSSQFHRSERSPMCPRTAYGISKAAAHWATVAARDRMHTVNVIMANHESMRRAPGMVLQKIVRAVWAIKNGGQKELRLGNLDAKCDWGAPEDYVRGMWMLMQTPGDYILCTGVLHTVRDACRIAFEAAGLHWQDHVVSDLSLYRTEDANLNRPDKAMALGWEPEIGFEEMLHNMVNEEVTA